MDALLLVFNERFLAEICIFSHFSFKFYWPQIDPKSESFRDLDANNQMSQYIVFTMNLLIAPRIHILVV